MITFYPTGVCATHIDFTVEDGIVTEVVFTGGCPGNLTAMSALVKGMPVEEVVHRLKGIECQNGTSCADQFARALTEELDRVAKPAE